MCSYIYAYVQEIESTAWSLKTIPRYDVKNILKFLKDIKISTVNHDAPAAYNEKPH